MDSWIAEAIALGIRSIICLLADEHLKLIHSADWPRRIPLSPCRGTA